jgi:hypothetical protein
MLDVLAKRCSSGDVWICAAKKYLRENEWGMAFRAVHAGLDKGSLSDVEEAISLLREVTGLLGVKDRVLAPYHEPED